LQFDLSNLGHDALFPRGEDVIAVSPKEGMNAGVHGGSAAAVPRHPERGLPRKQVAARFRVVCCRLLDGKSRKLEECWDSFHPDVTSLCRESVKASRSSMPIQVALEKRK
jgi:hypothetical protein